MKYPVFNDEMMEQYAQMSKEERNNFGAMWKVVDKTIPFNNKKLRSAGFAKSREQARKLVLKSKLAIKRSSNKTELSDFLD